MTNIYSIVEIRCLSSMVNTVSAEGSAMRSIWFYDNSRMYGGDLGCMYNLLYAITSWVQLYFVLFKYYLLTPGAPHYPDPSVSSLKPLYKHEIQSHYFTLSQGMEWPDKRKKLWNNHILLNLCQLSHAHLNYSYLIIHMNSNDLIFWQVYHCSSAL